ncbi:MAG: hypothetical protein WC385_01455 [Candidatus Paceibacterota bacterium]|jgi:hypothetical protein
MDKTKGKLTEYWDNLLFGHLPAHANLDKVGEEVKEHYLFVRLMWMRFIIPLVAFYLVMGLVFRINIFGALFLSLLVFIYSNILPDADILIKKTPEGKSESLWYEIFFLLCFAPIVVYYVSHGKAKPLFSNTFKPFHGLKAALVWAIFLFILGSLFWPDFLLKSLMLPIFGFVGYLFHLVVDDVIKLFSFRGKK